MTETHCELCQTEGGQVLVRARLWRIIDAGDPVFAGFTRVVWNAHVKEMTDLDSDSQARLIAIVLRVERVMRETLEPHKINLASLGNQVAHLHWHVIPRWEDDLAFPAPIWNAPAPGPDKATLAGLRSATVNSRLSDYHQALINEFQNET
ncbi:HIT family protein [Orrella marina]|uniref:HIT domain-containing protein n=1 Tax=Orrella marina TaxID=2163011 RepID=A0A2R4XL68_9BURK|nr:HIT family protein [Orrella marina]AWB34550.1 hypothetical protein DBV39_13450 [Orrella marina]